MKAVRALVLALVLLVSLVAGPGGSATVAQADDEPIWSGQIRWCKPGYTVHECGYLVMMYTAGQADGSDGKCHIDPPEECVVIVKVEQAFWSQLTSYELAKAGLAGYQDYAEYKVNSPNTPPGSLPVINGLLDLATQWVAAAFDPVTHEYNGLQKPLYTGMLEDSDTPTPTTKSFTKMHAPTISGTTKVGKTLRAKVKAWTPKASFGYQWYRSGVAIAGATKSSYKLVGTDYRAKITVQVTGTRSGYTAAVKTSKATKAVKAGTQPKGKVKVTGTAQVGNVITAKTYGKWSSGVTFTYQWYRSGKKLVGVTAQTYMLTAQDLGRKLKVKITATKLGYKTVTKMSKSTAKVK